MLQNCFLQAKCQTKKNTTTCFTEIIPIKNVLIAWKVSRRQGEKNLNINGTAIISTKNCCRHRGYDFMKDLKDIGKGANPKFFNNKFLSQSMCLVFSELSNLKRSGNHLKESYFGHFLEF